MSNQSLPLNDTLYQYLLDHSLRETDTLKRLREKTATMEMARMQIAPEQGQFMAMLVSLMNAKNIIEIGTFTGYSALWMAQALPEQGKILCCDISQEWTDIGREFWQEAGVDGRIDLQIAPARVTLDKLITDGRLGHFDLAFIDADKTGYKDYYERCLQLLRPGGLLIFDNVLWGGAVADPDCQDEDTKAIRELNKQLLIDERITISMLPVGDGLTLARKC